MHLVAHKLLFLYFIGGSSFYSLHYGNVDSIEWQLQPLEYKYNTNTLLFLSVCVCVCVWLVMIKNKNWIILYETETGKSFNSITHTHKHIESPTVFFIRRNCTQSTVLTSYKNCKINDYQLTPFWTMSMS